MKKVLNTGLVVAMIVMLSSTAKAQYFFTSSGYTQDWYLPQYIDYTIHDHYYGYQVAHARRIAHHGYYNYNVLLVRNGMYVEVRFDRFGNAYKTIRYAHYPLASHVCTPYCGYHPTYYRTYYYPTHYKQHHDVYEHHYYKHGHHQKTVYINSGHSHSRPYVNNQYYTNVYVQKPGHKQQHHQAQQYYKSGHDNHASGHQRSNGEIRKPVQQKQYTNEQVQRRASTGRRQYFSPQRVTRSSGNTTTGRKLIAYKNGRSKGH